jgi:hypothetical protein
VCKAQPTKIANNVTFIVDCSQLAHRKDLLGDDLGMWRSNGSRNTSFSAAFTPGGVSITVDESGDYVMYRTWYIHGTSLDSSQTCCINSR